MFITATLSAHHGLEFKFQNNFTTVFTIDEKIIQPTQSHPVTWGCDTGLV